MNKMVAEFIGTFTLVLFGCGAAVIAGADGTTGIGLAGISFAFGLALIGMAYGIGPVSGCHINPAVSLGAMLAGRMNAGEMIQYWIAQVAGAIVAALVLMIIASGSAGYGGGLGANGWGAGYLGEYSMASAFFSGGSSIAQLWLFIVAPAIGAAAAGILFKTGMLDGPAAE